MSRTPRSQPSLSTSTWLSKWHRYMSAGELMISCLIPSLFPSLMLSLNILPTVFSSRNDTFHPVVQARHLGVRHHDPAASSALWVHLSASLIGSSSKSLPQPDTAILLHYHQPTPNHSHFSWAAPAPNCSPSSHGSPFTSMLHPTGNHLLKM